jgi:hypothetical protein
VCIDARSGNFGSSGGQAGRPSQVSGRVVATMDIVLLQNGSDVVQITHIIDNNRACASGSGSGGGRAGGA